MHLEIYRFNTYRGEVSMTVKEAQEIMRHGDTIITEYLWFTSLGRKLHTIGWKKRFSKFVAAAKQVNSSIDIAESTDTFKKASMFVIYVYTSKRYAISSTLVEAKSMLID
ncbi:MAG: hypothetical protein KDC67_08835 [Ignavibacteriae bacterium]|nr:hypothetical protein [Ignavibacteriota bacterium]